MEKITNDIVFRCKDCLKIPYIKIFIHQIPNIDYSCDCNKKISNIIPINNFLNDFTLVSLNSMMCTNCSFLTNENNVNDMFLCFHCKKIFCENCKNIHGTFEYMNINKIDNYCFKHNSQFNGWCINCRKNLCLYCTHEKQHENCEIKYFNDIKIKSSDLKEYKSELKKFSYYFNFENRDLLNKMIKKCKTQEEEKEILDLHRKYNYNNLYLIIVSECILNTYLLYENKLNYQIIENLKICSSFNKLINLNENITIEEYKKYIETYYIINNSSYENEDEKTENVKELPSEYHMNDFSDNENDSTFISSNNSNINDKSNNSDHHNHIIFINNNINIIDNSNKSVFYNSITNISSNNINNYNNKFENDIKSINIEKNCKKNSIEKIKIIKTIQNPEKRAITYLLILHNNRLAIANCIYIEIKDENKLKTLLKIKKHRYQISTLAQLKDHRLVSGDVKGNIKLWSFDDIKYECVGNIKSDIENMKILKLISLSNKKLASLTEKIIEIWNIDFKTEKYLEYKLDNNEKFSSLLETKNNILVSSSPSDYLRTYDVNTLTKKKELSNVYCSSLNSLIEINNNRIAIGSYEKIFIVNMNDFQIENFIRIDSVITSLYLLNDNTLLVSKENLELAQYDMENMTILGSIKKATPIFIISSCQISNKYIVTASFTFCHFWEFYD